MSDKPIGVYSMGLCSIEIYDIDSDNVRYKFNSGNKEEKMHRAKIHFNPKSGDPYFDTMFGRVKLNNVLRTNI